MNKQVDMSVISVTLIAHQTFEMVLKNEYVSKNAIPGQFLHILIDGHTLRRPISIADVDEDAGTITIIFKTIGEGTKKLSSYIQGQQVDVLGPGGHGFPIDGLSGTTVLLIGGGVGTPPLHYLGKKLAEDQTITLISILGFQSKEHIFYEDKFRQFGETIVMTDDGSYGNRGFVTDALAHLNNFERFYTCGPTPMLKAVTHKLDQKDGYISLEEYMGCGIGACFACVIPTTEPGGYKKICQDGPVFSAKEVQL